MIAPESSDYRKLARNGLGEAPSRGGSHPKTTSFWHKSFSSAPSIEINRLQPSWRVVERKGMLCRDRGFSAEAAEGSCWAISFLLVGL